MPKTNAEIMKSIDEMDVFHVNHVEMRLTREEFIAKKYVEIMGALGLPRTEDNKETPARVAKSLLEMSDSSRTSLAQLDEQMTTFPAKLSNQLVKVDDIEFSSLCAHHHLPFYGKVSIKYIPGDRILGLSKFARVVEWFSKMPQTQEDLTKQIFDYLNDILEPNYIAIKIHDSVHTCMRARGVKSSATTSTLMESGNSE